MPNGQLPSAGRNKRKKSKNFFGGAVAQKNQLDEIDRYYERPHFRWLLYVSVAVIAIGAGFLLFVQLTQPRVFDEKFAFSLLQRHDSTLNLAEFDPDPVESEDGRESIDFIFEENLRDNTTIFARKEASISLDPVDNRTIEATYLLVGSKPLAEFRGRSWSCPYNTYYNVTTDATDRYYFLGLATNYLPIRVFASTVEQMPGYNSEEFNRTFTLGTGEIPPGYYGTYRGEFFDWSYLLSQMREIDLSQVWYFNPEQKEAYDRQLSELLDGAEGCTEIAV